MKHVHGPGRRGKRSGAPAWVQRRADALLENLIPHLRAALVEHLGGDRPRRGVATATPEELAAGELVDEVTRAKARALLAGRRGPR